MPKFKSQIIQTTLRTIAKAQYYLEAKSPDDFIEAKKISLTKKFPLTIIGGGSNIALIQKEIKGLVVKNAYIDKKVVAETADYVDLSVSSGYPVGLLINETVDAGWSGFEYHKGLPGTVGGAIYMNAKWTRPVSYFGDRLISANLVDANGKVKCVDRNYFQFAYDSSILQKTKEILIEAVFRLPKENPAVLRKRAEGALAYRQATQPMGVATSGCFFQNINGTSAGYLIDKAGLKGYSVGGFYVSDKHANFIVNRGNGKAEDLIKLTAIIKEKVKEKFGVEMKEEVVVV